MTAETNPLDPPVRPLKAIMVEPFAEGGFRIFGNNVPGTTNEIERSSDGHAWSRIALDIAASGDSAEFTATTAPNSATH